MIALIVRSLLRWVPLAAVVYLVAVAFAMALPDDQVGLALFIRYELAPRIAIVFMCLGVTIDIGRGIASHRTGCHG